jgi:hypothetical protein
MPYQLVRAIELTLRNQNQNLKNPAGTSMLGCHPKPNGVALNTPGRAVNSVMQPSYFVNKVNALAKNLVYCTSLITDSCLDIPEARHLPALHESSRRSDRH